MLAVQTTKNRAGLWFKAAGYSAALTMLFVSCSGTPEEPAIDASTEEIVESHVTEYWAIEPGIVLRFEGTRERNGQLVGRDRLTLRSGGSSELDGEPVEVQYLETIAEDVGGGAVTGAMTVFQHVDEQSTFTRAVQFEDGEARIIENSMVHLTAPLTRGTTWMSSQLEGFAGLGVHNHVQMNYTSAIMDTEGVLTLAGLTFMDCLKVIDAGVSAADHSVTCADGSEAVCKIIVDRMRWWAPGLGGVQEETVTAAIRTDGSEGSEGVCSEVRASYQLVDLETD